MIKTLLTAKEAVDLSPSDAHSYVQERCTHIPFVEEELFSDCFGWLFYEHLLNDLAEYNALRFSETQAYTAGQYVEHAGCIYLVTNNTGEAGQAISNPAYFVKAPKFTTPANEKLWRNYLGSIIAFRVMQGGLLYRSVRDTARGVVKSFDPDSSRPATNAEVRSVKEELGADIERMIKAMDAYIKRNALLYPMYKKSTQQCGDKDGTCQSYNPRKNFGFIV